MKLKNIVESVLDKNIFILEVKENVHQDMIRVTVDSERSISLAETSKIAKNIRESKEINLLYPNGVRIEVTTPGISSPLEFTFQYKKNIFFRRVQRKS